MTSRRRAPPPGPDRFAARLLRWFDRHGRRDLPWQSDPTPYRVWVSEIMLQQTRAAAAAPFFRRFMERFPDVEALARADEDQVLHLWSGLGYYARARRLHRTARIIVDGRGGGFPADPAALERLPGIGRSTAGAIAALAMGVRAPILDGNAKRVLARAFAVDGPPDRAPARRRLWELAERLTPRKRVRDYTQAIMDLGAGVCAPARPACGRCPLRGGCAARRLDAVDRYPGRAPKAALPVRTVAMYILRNRRGDVLLRKRPAEGVWGSLYSLPEGPAGLKSLAVGRRTVALDGATALAPLRHTFSHYHLDITPMRVDVPTDVPAAAPGGAEKGRWLWYPPDRSVEVGLAAPVKRLLSRLARGE